MSNKCFIEGCDGFNYTEINPFVVQDIGSYWTMIYPTMTPEVKYKCTKENCKLNTERNSR